MTNDDEPPTLPDDSPRADTLHPATVAEIERLRTAVLNAEAEQRFGVGHGRRSDLVLAAEEAERTFLNAHGFATYNDYRLRIRRSTVISASSVGGATSTPDASLTEPDDVAADTPTGPDAADVEAESDSAVAVDRAVESLPRPQLDGAPAGAAGEHLHAFASVFVAAVITATDEMVASVIDAAEAQAATTLAQASTQAADITERAERVREAARSVADRTAQHLDTLHAFTADVERLRRTNTTGTLTTTSPTRGATD